MDPAVELNQADEIAGRILTRQSVSENEFRYAVMFNLTAMTQLLWELSNTQRDRSRNDLGPSRTRPASQRGITVKNRAVRLAPVAAIAAFLAGLGLGYLIP
jgi:hypothetical protein